MNKIKELVSDILKESSTPLEAGEKIAAIFEGKNSQELQKELPSLEAAFSHLCYHWIDHAHKFDTKYLIYYKSFLKLTKTPKTVTPYIMGKMLIIAGYRNAWLPPDTKKVVTSAAQAIENQQGHRKHKNV